MPSLLRLLFILGVIAGLFYGSMLALVVFVEPTPREMTVKIPAKRLNPQ
ncbi:MAG: histidine kinase [Pseudomonadota bacterium]